MQSITHVFRLISFSVLFICCSVFCRASHLVGADLRYEWVSGSTYKIVMYMYGDCGPASAAAFATLPSAAPRICVYNGSSLLATLTLAIDTPTAGLEVTPPICPGYSSQCADPSSPVIGIKLFVYSATYTLPGAGNYKFVFNGNHGSSTAGRAAAITNLSVGSTIQLEAILNTTVGNNSNPVLHIIPLPYYGNSMPHNYNPIAIDAEGDSLVYELYPAKNGTSGCTTPGGSVSYAAGTSYNHPLQTAPGAFFFDSLTGQMSFFPNVVQRSVVIYNIKEYRAGVLIGAMQRELTVLILSATEHLPTGRFDSSTAGTIIDSIHHHVCITTGAFSVSIHPTDIDGDNITIDSFLLPAGALLHVTGNGTANPIATFSWNTTGLAPGMYTFFLKYTDNGCPMAGSQIIAYHIQVAALPCTLGALTTQANQQPVIYPNPSKGCFSIHHSAGSEDPTIVVTDVLNRSLQVPFRRKSNTEIEIDLSAYPNGSYFVTVGNSNLVSRSKVLLAR